MIWKLHYNIGRINSNPNSRSHSKSHHPLSTLVLAPCLPQSQHKALLRSRRLVLRRHRHRCTCPQARRHVSHHDIINETKAKLFDYFLLAATHTHTHEQTYTPQCEGGIESSGGGSSLHEVELALGRTLRSATAACAVSKWMEYQHPQH